MNETPRSLADLPTGSETNVPSRKVVVRQFSYVSCFFVFPVKYVIWWQLEAHSLIFDTQFLWALVLD
jgi:hypothetical protein